MLTVMRIVWLIVAFTGCSTAPAAKSVDPKTVDLGPLTRHGVVAHRGFSAEAPENTLAAFQRAWQAGVECVELDVHLTRDGIPVVIHDDDTKRTTGHPGKVKDQTLAELALLDAGSWMAPSFAGERIPTLAAALATIPDGRTMFVEIKTGPETAPAIARAIRDSGKRVALQGFDPTALAALARELPGMPAYWTVDPPMTDEREPRPLPYPMAVVDETVARGFAGIALYHAVVSDDLVARFRAASVLVDVWTVNEPGEFARWSDRDVRWIETDRPDLAPLRSVIR